MAGAHVMGWALTVLLLAGAGAGEEPAAFRVPAAKLARAEGAIYLPLTGAVDGPVWLPIGESILPAIQALVDLGAGRATVRIAHVRADFGVQPLASYVLPLGHAVSVEVDELRQVGLESWTLSLDSIEPGAPGCSRCGEVVCCPLEGECLACALCGRTCRGPAADPAEK